MNPQYRDLIYFNPSLAADDDPGLILPSIKQQGWVVYWCAEFEQVMQTVATQDALVGVVQFDTSVETSIDTWREHIVPLSHGMEWVVLLPPACLQQTGIRQFIRECFYDYHTIPYQSERLANTLGHAFGMATLYGDDSHCEEAALGDNRIIGNSVIMDELRQNLQKVARVEAPVLITGESGTGKELAASAIHQQSRRAQAPFITVNCGALPTHLVQAELFGHEKGAFTGAQQRKIGYIEAADGGTLFLDEIGDLPLDLQVNLLRFLQEGTVERVGSTEQLQVDVRVIAATHVELERAITEERFRSDLYYRLNVLNIVMPALRHRNDDIETLAEHIFERYASEKQRQLKGFSRQALRTMRNYYWPGNVRELVNRVRRAMVMSERRLLSADDLGLTDLAPAASVITLDEIRTGAEKQAIQQALTHSRNNVSQAARSLKVSRRQLYRLMEKHDLMDPDRVNTVHEVAQ